MVRLMNFNEEALELNKVLRKITEFANTSLGKEKLSKLSPITNLEKINKSLNDTCEAIDAINRYGSLKLNFKDINKYLGRAKIDSTLKTDEILHIKQFIENVEKTIFYKQELDDIKFKCTSLTRYFDDILPLKQVLNRIDLVMDDNGMILDSASDDLGQVRRNKRNKESRLRNKLQEIISSGGVFLAEPLIVIRDDRYCLPIKSAYKNSFKGIIHDESQSGNTFYIEPRSCVQISEDIFSLENEERIIVNRILNALTTLIKVNIDAFNVDIYNLVCLDEIYAKANFSLAENYNRVSIVNNGYLDLLNAKHPLIDKDICVPVSIYFRDEYQSIIITGPNTGGKTIALKTVGLLTLMSMCGLLIPASTLSTINIFDNVFVDIGDEQSIEESLSTFSSHMTKIVKITNDITINSLVLIDELGSGTDPREGSVLAISILEFLQARGAKTIVTSHYSALKNYAYANKNVCNASVLFDVETLRPTYKLLMGIPGKSNALLISERLGLDNRITNEAARALKIKTKDVDTLMETLEDTQLSYHKKIEEYEQLINNQKNKEKQLDEKLVDLEKTRNDVIKKASNEAEILISAEKEKIDSMIKELDTLRKSGLSESHKLADIKYQSKNIGIKTDNNTKANLVFKEGEYVFIESYDKYGIILKRNKNKYYIKIGQFSMWFNKNDIRSAEKPKEIKKKVRVVASGSIPASAHKLELDLRGVRYDEVKDLVDKFLDNAYLGNAKQVSIIHGFGTGAVRDAVRNYLKKSSIVENYRYGKEGEGLNGVTVVTLK